MKCSLTEKITVLQDKLISNSYENNYESIDNALDIESSIVEREEVKPVPSKPDNPDIKKDYEYTRANLYSLIEKGKKQSMELWNLLILEQVQEHMKLRVN